MPNGSLTEAHNPGDHGATFTEKTFSQGVNVDIATKGTSSNYIYSQKPAQTNQVKG
jgi:hypothetical protein